ncbi:hypothetical protein [Shewanella woodyi]|uniref:hypothetical protein n=1 Tax=Shewanella woodyi TaxID=60961 RepID=UPI0002F547FA|nr:hypothetical protein [Shewanella woodyi]
MKLWSLNRVFHWLTGKPRDSKLIQQLDFALSGGYHSQDWLIRIWQASIKQSNHKTDIPVTD